MMRGIDPEGGTRAPLRIKAVILAEKKPKTRVASAFGGVSWFHRDFAVF